MTLGSPARFKPPAVAGSDFNVGCTVSAYWLRVSLPAWQPQAFDQLKQRVLTVYTLLIFRHAAQLTVIDLQPLQILLCSGFAASNIYVDRFQFTLIAAVNE